MRQARVAIAIMFLVLAAAQAHPTARPSRTADRRLPAALPRVGGVGGSGARLAPPASQRISRAAAAAAPGGPRVLILSFPRNRPLTATPSVAPLTRARAAAGAFGNASPRRGQVSAVLGGPATFDARRLVRR